jgi:hypothetical protein
LINDQVAILVLGTDYKNTIDLVCLHQSLRRETKEKIVYSYGPGGLKHAQFAYSQTPSPWLYFEIAGKEIAQETKELRRIGPDARLDPEFLLSTGFKTDLEMEARPLLTRIDGEPRILFAWGLYDEQGRKLVTYSIDPNELGNPPKTKPLFGYPSLGPAGDTVLVPIGIDYGVVVDLFGVYEFRLSDGKLLGERWGGVLNSRDFRYNLRLFPFVGDPTGYLLTSYEYIYDDNAPHPQPAKLRYPGTVDASFEVKAGFWMPVLRNAPDPSSSDGILSRKGLIYGGNWQGFGEESSTALAYEVDEDQQIHLKPWIQTEDSRLASATTDYGRQPYWLGNGEAIVPADGEFGLVKLDPSGKVSFSAEIPYRGEVLHFLSEARTSNSLVVDALVDKDSRLFLSKINTDDLSVGSHQYLGVFTPKIKKVFAEKDGKVVLWGEFQLCKEETGNHCTVSEPLLLIRLDLANHAADPNFRPWKGCQYFSGDKKCYFLRSVAQDPARPGGLYVAGVSEDPSGEHDVFFGKLLPNGEADPGYWWVDTLNQVPAAILGLKDGSVYLGGYLSKYRGQDVPRLIRLKPDGELDSSFDIGVGVERTNSRPDYRNPFVSDIFKVSPESDDILVFGNFFSVNSVTSPYVARLSRTGQVLSPIATAHRMVPDHRAQR